MKRRTVYSSLTLTVLFGFILGTFSVPVAYAQPQALSPKASQFLKQVPAKQAYQDAGAVIVLKEVTMKVEKGGSYALRVHIVGKILDEKVAPKYNQISVGFNSFYEDAFLTFARTIRENGTIREVSGDAFQIKTLPERSRYSDVRILTFSLPALEKGSAFEYEVRIQHKLPLIEKNWFEAASFHHYCHSEPPRADPVYRSQFILDLPEGEDFIYRVKNASTTPSTAKNGGRIIYTWELLDLPPIPLETDMLPSRMLGPRLYVSSVKNWSEIAKWANEICLPETRVTPEIETKAREITKPFRTEEEKIAALFYFIEENIEYIGADINRGGYKPHPAHEVLRNRYGDCKDQAVLFVSLLRALNMEAYPVLIETYPSDEIDPEVPSPRFPHMIVYIPRKNSSLWLDTTASAARFPHLSWYNSDKLALIIDGKSDKLEKTPASKSEETRGKMTAQWNFNGSDLKVSLTAEATGNFDITLKTAMKSLTSDQQKQFFIDFANYALGKPGKVGAIEFSEITNPRIPYRANVNLEYKDARNVAAPSFSYHLGVIPAFVFFGRFHEFPQPEYRKNDYWMPFPFSITFEQIYEPPSKGMKPVTIPSNQSNPLLPFHG